MALNRYGMNSEYGRLSSVMLYKPLPSIGNHHDPALIQQIAPIDHAELTEQLDRVINTFSSLDVQVTLIDQPEDPFDISNFNMMFCRDLFFMTPQGAILANMANETRRNEVIHAASALVAAGVPVLHKINGNGQFEGADALWLNSNLVAVGVGNRTNMAAFEQISAVLALQNVSTLALPSFQSKTQHMLGSLQLVDSNLALVRNEIISSEIIDVLDGNGFRIVPIPDNGEVLKRQAMNIVTIAPRQIIMTSDCPETKQLYIKAGIRIVAELPISQLINGAGGLACATGVLARLKI